jgi:hypothetical protein
VGGHREHCHSPWQAEICDTQFEDFEWRDLLGAGRSGYRQSRTALNFSLQAAAKSPSQRGLSRYSTGEESLENQFRFSPSVACRPPCSITRTEGGPAACIVAHDGGSCSLRRIYERASQPIAHDEVWCSVRPIDEYASQPVGHDEVWRSVLPDDESTSHAVPNFLSRCGQSRKHEQPSNDEGGKSFVHG